MWDDYLIKSKIHYILNMPKEELDVAFLMAAEDYDEGKNIQQTFVAACSAHYRSNTRHEYINEARSFHLLQVALVLDAVGASVPQIKAGLLHDIVGVSDWSLETIFHRFGEKVGSIVEGVQNGIMSPDAKTVKLACVLGNLHSGIKSDHPNLPQLVETTRLSLPNLKEGNSILMSAIYDIIEHCNRTLVS